MQISIATIDSNNAKSHTVAMNGAKDFGNLIRSARMQRGWDQNQLAERLGRDGSFISRIETGRSANPPDPHMIRTLAEVLGISPVLMLEELGYLEQKDTDEIDRDHFDIPEDVKTALRTVKWDKTAVTLVLSTLNYAIPRMREAQEEGE